ncbi:hypothetical protein GCM10011360_27200 [Primorskyibacter flagellatus]|uniref:YncI copper-binding domain-containing protein n=1 Tax=Primorskyibacter flagellatus TaxID=1387277 RepID=A0A917AB27_9RHOB|nr:DUF1775 domain-containing protein [Primorskyibacter flagellatus]GGE37946.1 hypothetical protein GCM10011360_27200 [Primorskyibacter flagellatus]
MRPIILAGAFATLAGSALAHATLEQKDAAAGTTTKITLRVPHGCAGEATHTVRLTLPDGFYAAKPMPKPGWTLSTAKGDYAVPYDNHGTEMREGLREVVWSGGHLEDGWYDEFTVRGTFGAAIEPGTVLYFPALQECAGGTADWTDTTGSHDVPNPAPSITISAAAGEHGHGHGHGAASMDETVRAGALEISGAFTRATLPNAPVAGGFMTIANTGQNEDRLLSATSPIAGRVEIHEMAMEGDVMRMRALPDGLALPAGDTVTLAPGGYHLMFMELKQALPEGDSVPVTLRFRDAGEVDVTLTVGPTDAGAHAGMKH